MQRQKCNTSLLCLQLRMMYEAYCSYNSGLERALETLSGLRDYDQLRQFLHTPEDELTVEDFLNRPIQVTLSYYWQHNDGVVLKNYNKN